MELSTKIEQLETSANTNNCTINDELTHKVANLEVISTTPTEALKKKGSIFYMPKNDASTSL